MKKLTLLLLLSVLYSASYSQTFHIEAGLSFAKLDMNYRMSGAVKQIYKAPLLAPTFSTGIEYFQHKNFSISSDLYYYESGGKFSEEEYGNENLYTPIHISVWYLSYGSAFNFYPLNKKLKLQLSLGPKIDYIRTSESAIPYGWIDKSKKINKFSVGYTTGIGLYYKLNNRAIGVNMKYFGRMQKLSDVRASNNDGFDASDQIFLICLSYKFRFK